MRELILAVVLGTGSVFAGVVENWNAAFLQAVRKESPPPCLVSRNLPIFHLSIYRAIQAAAESGLAPTEQEDVGSLAGRRAFLEFFPSQTKLADDQMPAMRYGATVAQLANQAVERTFKERENDGASTTIHYVPVDKPGQWRRTPPTYRPPEFPHWGLVKPFVLDDLKPFRAPPPPDLNSSTYARGLNEVKEIGGKTSELRTAEQELIAHFWSDFSYTTSPAGHWNDIARSMSQQRHLPLMESARLFAVLNTAMADTCIAIWDTKYHYNYWRPVTAIQRANEDDNNSTQPDARWIPLLESPPHPEYPSGHSGVSGAAATILEHFFAADNVSFDVESDDVKDTIRQFTSFQSCAKEIAASRIYGGIHYSFSGEAGLVLGRRVAAEVLRQLGK